MSGANVNKAPDLFSAVAMQHLSLHRWPRGPRPHGSVRRCAEVGLGIGRSRWRLDHRPDRVLGGLPLGPSTPQVATGPTTGTNPNTGTATGAGTTGTAPNPGTYGGHQLRRKPRPPRLKPQPRPKPRPRPKADRRTAVRASRASRASRKKATRAARQPPHRRKPPHHLKRLAQAKHRTKPHRPEEGARQTEGRCDDLTRCSIQPERIGWQTAEGGKKDVPENLDRGTIMSTLKSANFAPCKAEGASAWSTSS